jgi:hypothetical protein
MKNFLSLVVAFGLAAGAVAPAFAAEAPKNKADCEKAKMKWDETTKKCTKGAM